MPSSPAVLNAFLATGISGPVPVGLDPRRRDVVHGATAVASSRVVAELSDDDLGPKALVTAAYRSVAETLGAPALLR
ncbi:hypothetical protein [Streptomyces sp. NPDC052042]|uniref:hypothetical protein n=1 Tax=Streptomyces sp. NPDC052042 TaxID=3365683 RepID=UPI0037D48798